MTETIQKKKRDVSLDIAKGILIFLVVWGHSILYGFGYGYGEAGKYWHDYVYRAIYTFHMPLFMAISGYLFYYSNKKPFREVMLSRLKSIGIPYLTYCTITVLLLAPFKGWAESFVMDTYANGYWFLTSVLFNCIIVSIVTYVTRKRVLVTAILLLIDIILLFVDENYLYKTHNYMYTCFIIGYLYNAHLQRPITFKKTKRSVGIVLLILFILCVSIFKDELYVYGSGVCILKDGGINLHQYWVDLVRCSIGFCCSIFFLYMIPLFQNLREMIKEKIYLMSHFSIGIYCLSDIILTIYYKVLGNLGIEIPFNYITPIILAIVVVIISCVILRYCEKRKLLNTLFLGGR